MVKERRDDDDDDNNDEDDDSTYRTDKIVGVRGLIAEAISRIEDSRLFPLCGFLGATCTTSTHGL